MMRGKFEELEGRGIGFEQAGRWVGRGKIEVVEI